MRFFKDIGWGIFLEFKSIKEFLCYVIGYGLGIIFSIALIILIIFLLAQ